MIAVNFNGNNIPNCFYPEDNYEKCIDKLSQWFKENNSRLTSEEIEVNIGDFLDTVATNNKKMIKKTGKKYNFDMRKNDDFDEYSINIDSKTFIETCIVSRCYIKTDNKSIMIPNYTYRTQLDKIIETNPNNMIPAKHIFESRLKQTIITNPKMLDFQEYNVGLHFWKEENPEMSPTEEQILSMKYDSFKHSLYYFLSNNCYNAFIQLCESAGLLWCKKTMDNNTEYYCITIGNIVFHFVNQVRLTLYQLK